MNEAGSAQASQKMKHNPESSAGFLSKITFWYLQPLLKLGFQRPLEMVINTYYIKQLSNDYYSFDYDVVYFAIRMTCTPYIGETKQSGLPASSLYIGSVS